MIGPVFCKAKEGFKIKVGSIEYSPVLGTYVFKKHKPHLMKVVGVNGGYGIQKFVRNSIGTEYDILNLFRKSPDMVVIIQDETTGRNWLSKAIDWIEHQHKGNYGDGSQIFLSVDYMKEAKLTKEAGHAQLSI